MEDDQPCPDACVLRQAVPMMERAEARSLLVIEIWVTRHMARRQRLSHPARPGEAQ